MNLRWLAAILALAFAGAELPCGNAQAAGGAKKFLKHADAWFSGDEAKQVSVNILSWQSELGGWPKNENTTRPYAGDRAKLKPTFDNGATTDELRFLARRFQATRDEACRQGFDQGLKYILQAQYPTGGWPQFHPPGTGYHRHITFNDNAMVRLLVFLREVQGDKLYAFVAAADRESARQAFDRGIACILKCQVRVDGQLTTWCAQHDEIDYRPRPARKFELVSLSGNESVGIVRLLMSLEKPSPEVVASVEGAIAWFEKSKLTGIRLEEFRDLKAAGCNDRRVVQDPAAPPLWARFYEIGTNRPFFCDRDGIPKYQLSEIGHERRNGYDWFGDWPRTLLEKEYPQWKASLRSD